MSKLPHTAKIPGRPLRSRMKWITFTSKPFVFMTQPNIQAEVRLGYSNSKLIADLDAFILSVNIMQNDVVCVYFGYVNTAEWYKRMNMYDVSSSGTEFRNEHGRQKFFISIKLIGDNLNSNVSPMGYETFDNSIMQCFSPYISRDRQEEFTTTIEDKKLTARHMLTKF